MNSSEIDQVTHNKLNNSEEDARLAFQKAEDQFQKSRMPLYVIVVAAFLIAVVNSIFISSSTVFLMCLIFGGGTIFYLYRTRNNGPELPKTSDKIYDPTKREHDR